MTQFKGIKWQKMIKVVILDMIYNVTWRYKG